MLWKRSSGLAAMLYLWSAATACEEPTFSSPTEVDGLRILGLQSSASLVVPGQQVELSALWVDVQATPDEEMVTAWFPGCTNPQFGSIENCQKQLNSLRPAPGQEWPTEFAPVRGSETSFMVDPALLEGSEEYGLQYFFFAVCRGTRFEFSPSEHSTIPIICRDARGSQPDLRLGYRTVTALPLDKQLDTTIPMPIGFEVGGKTYEPHCLGAACRGFKQADCDVNECPELLRTTCDPEADKGGGKGGDEECEGTTFRLLLDEDNIGIDYLAGDDDGLRTVEVFARYFVEGGEVSRETDLLHEAVPLGNAGGWDRESQSSLRAQGDRFLWAVVYDSMGGVNWAGLGVRMR